MDSSPLSFPGKNKGGKGEKNDDDDEGVALFSKNVGETVMSQEPPN